MDRYIVWACFGVDAENPEQAKEIVNHVVDAETYSRIGMYDKYRINATVFISPKLDMLFGEGIDDDGG